MKVISSWSGGKDSTLASYKAILAGYEITFLANFISKESKRCCFHGITSELMRAQSHAINIPIIQKEVSSDMDNYEDEFKQIVGEIRDKHGINGMVFGDIYLEEHKNWVERVCKDLDIIPIQPLWNIQPEKVINEFISCGFKAVVVSSKAGVLNEDFLGKDINKDLVNELKEKNICLCGENGEFHSFVYDGPIFKTAIKITKSEKVLKEGFWKHWFLDIKEYSVINKGNIDE